MKRTHGLDEREVELARLLMAECRMTGDIQAKLKKLFAGTIEQMLEAEIGKHYYVILGHIQKKLCRVIYSVLKSGSLYSSAS